jgi:hypothetical protein
VWIISGKKTARGIFSFCVFLQRIKWSVTDSAYIDSNKSISGLPFATLPVVSSVVDELHCSLPVDVCDFLKT